MHKFAKINLPDAVYNWIKDFFNSRTHCTKFQGEVSELADILASVVQGSGLGPAAYFVNAADLRPIHPGNELIKFTDDTVLICTWSSQQTITTSAKKNYSKSRSGPTIIICD